MNVAAILAGGTGKRIGNKIPKQFLTLNGKKVIEYTIEGFQNNQKIDEIAIVSNSANIHDVEDICSKNKYSKVKRIFVGGKERYNSSLTAINACDGDDLNILIHDAVKPLLNNRIINDCITKLEICNAVNVIMPVADTIVQVNQTGTISGFPRRESLYHGQSPQAFKLKTIRKAYELALRDPNFKTNDDCSVVYKYLPDEPIYIVKGESFNMKLTYEVDIYLLEKWIQLKSVPSSFSDQEISQIEKSLSRKL